MGKRGAINALSDGLNNFLVAQAHISNPCTKLHNNHTPSADSLGLRLRPR